MLVLQRKSQEAIVLNGVIVIRILSIDDGRVKLGIDAPPDVIIVREELLDEDSRPQQRTRQTTYTNESEGE